MRHPLGMISGWFWAWGLYGLEALGFTAAQHPPNYPTDCFYKSGVLFVGVHIDKKSPAVWYEGPYLQAPGGQVDEDNSAGTIKAWAPNMWQ